MEIQQAADVTVSSLTLKEKKLARDLLYSEQYHKATLSAWIRAPVLKLAEALNQTRSAAKAAGFTARFFSLFCDTLVIDQGATILPEKDGDKELPFEINLYARKLEYLQSPTNPAFHVRFTKDSELWFWTARLPDSFQISFESKSSPRQIYAPKIDKDSFGVALRLEDSGKSISTEPLSAPDESMQNIDYLSLIGDDGKLRSKAYLNDDLPRLLQFQMLVAQTHIHVPSKRGLAVELLTYIVAATTNPRASALHHQASALLSSLLVQTGVVKAPSVNIYASKQILKSRLVAALAFEEAFRDFSLEAENRKVQGQTAIDLLRKSQDAIATYKFLKDIRQREYDNAVVANDKAAKTFTANQESLKKLGDAFQAGVEDWKEAAKEEAAKSVLKGLVMVGIAIGATVATGGAAAATIPAAAGSAINAASKIAALIAKLKTIYAKVKEIYEKIKPVIEKLKEVVKVIKDVIESLRKFSGATAGTKNFKLSADSSDVFNATAEWRRFDITVREMEESLKEYKIKGKEDYFHALKILVPNGECFILTQANLVKTGDELATVLVQSQAEQKNESRLASTAFNIANDSSVLDLLVRAMFDRVLTIRSLVYIDFLTYSSAQIYHTLSQGPEIMLSPVKPVVDYLEDITKLQGAIVAFGSQVLVQQRTFTFRTLAGFNTAGDLATALKAGQPVRFSIEPSSELFRRFGRIRLSRARCYLEGLKLSTTTNTPSNSTPLPLRLELETEPQFFDLPLDQIQTPDIIASPPRAFLGASRRIIFEYAPTDNSISCDGWYGQERDYTKFSPMTQWTVQVVYGDSDAGTLGAADLDFQGFGGLRLEVLCDFTLR